MGTTCRAGVRIGCGVLLLAGTSCRVFVSVDTAWERAVAKNTKEVFVSFVKVHKDTKHTPVALSLLERHATARGNYAVRAIRPANRTPRTTSRVKIAEDHGGRLKVDGVVEHELNPMTGRLENLLWNPGAEHTILCTLILEGYTFLSDMRNPLVFEVTTEHGYTYKRGHGLVVEPNGNLISLGLRGLKR